jgi:hypothetical protein
MATATESAAPAGASEKTSTKKTSTKKVPALLLTQGGAPTEWHVIHGVGYVHPTIPSPVGGDGEPSIGRARELAAADGCAVKLVEVTVSEAQEGRAARAKVRGEGLAAARELRKLGKRGSRADANQVQTEVAAAAGKE